MTRFNEFLKKLHDELALQKEQVESLEKIMNLLNQNPLSSERENNKRKLEQRICLARESYEKYKKIISNIKSEADLAKYQNEMTALVREEEKMLMNNLESLNKTLDKWREKEKDSLELYKKLNKPKH